MLLWRYLCTVSWAVRLVTGCMTCSSDTVVGLSHLLFVLMGHYIFSAYLIVPQALPLPLKCMLGHDCTKLLLPWAQLVWLNTAAVRVRVRAPCARMSQSATP
jgi:hypothetical protein